MSEYFERQEIVGNFYVATQLLGYPHRGREYYATEVYRVIDGKPDIRYESRVLRAGVEGRYNAYEQHNQAVQQIKEQSSD